MMSKEHILIYNSYWLLYGGGRRSGRVYTLRLLGETPSPKFKEINHLLELFGVEPISNICYTNEMGVVPLENFTEETLSSFLECCKMQGINYRLLEGVF
jgi:hypothetical protein